MTMSPRAREEDQQQHDENEPNNNGPVAHRRRRRVRVLEGMSDEERRALRNSQRQLHAALVADEYENLHHVREKNNGMFENVKYTRELVLDGSNVELLTNKLVKEVEQKVQVPRYDASKLIHTLVQKCSSDSNGSFDWKTLGTEAGVCFNTVPARCSFLAGRWDALTGLAASPKKRRAPRRQQQHTTDPNAKEEKPQDVHKEDQNAATGGEQSSSYAEQQVLRIRKKLKTEFQDDPNKSVDGISFLFDPQSFTKTVENLFYFSFQIKKSQAGIKVATCSSKMQIGEQQHRTTTTTPAAQLQLHPVGLQGESPPARQGIVSLTLRDFRRLSALSSSLQCVEE